MARDIRCMHHSKIFDRTNEDETCLWCGRILCRSDHKIVDGHWKRVGERRGAYNDGAFCTLRCAASFGTAAAFNGFRLQPFTRIE